MRILVTGANGMIGRKLAKSLATASNQLTLTDVTPGDDILVADLATPGTAETLLAGKPELIFHLAAIVSGEAEADMAKGYRVNLDGTRALFEAIRQAGHRPRVVFTSSIAVYGRPFPDTIDDDFALTPHTSYGVQKVIAEQLLADYSRRGFLDGIGLRLPNICIRRGAPNKAASGFFSNILREPLAGREAVLPVGEDVRMWHASPDAAVGFLEHAATIDLAPLGIRRSMMMPGLSATVAEQIEALRRAAGAAAVRLIRHQPDAALTAMFHTFPGRFDTARASALGFVAETSFDEIIAAHLREK